MRARPSTAVATRGWVAAIAAVLLVPALVAQEPTLRTASTTWDAATLGNHRAVLRVESPARAVRAVIPWRRRDANSEQRLVIVTDESGRRIGNVRRGRIDREAGEIWFEPIAGAGRYFAYYLPFTNVGRRNYPNVTYLPVEESADAGWLASTDAPGAASAHRRRSRTSA